MSLPRFYLPRVGDVVLHFSGETRLVEVIADDGPDWYRVEDVMTGELRFAYATHLGSRPYNEMEVLAWASR